MTDAAPEPAAMQGGRSWFRLHVALPVAAFSLLWIDLIRQLSFNWSTREQYTYGWFVPLFCLYAFWQRWLDRPAAVPSGVRQWNAALVIIFAALLLPMRVIFEVNADWPLIGWIYTGIVAALALQAVYLVGGSAWVRHFAFPILFILAAVTWPYRIEKALTQSLMKVVAGMTVEALGWLHLPAFQHGNLIEVRTGVVGVDEACSGIRSFQSTLMSSLLLGELYRLKFLSRVVLVVLGVVLALGLNVVRAFFLSWQASIKGVEIIDRWHDPAGLSILGVCFVGLWLVALGIGRGVTRTPASQPGDTGVPLLLPARCCWYLTALGAWGICILAATELWYRADSAGRDQELRWAAAFPTNAAGFKEIELTPRVQRLMAHDEGGAASWLENDGSEWSAYFFRWHPRSVESVIRSRVHRPEVCLSAAGLRQVGDSSLISIEAGSLTLPFRKYIYEAGSELLYVFFCQWEDGDVRQQGIGATKQADRLQSVLARRRRVGQQTLELILSGYANASEAELALRSRLGQLIRPENYPISSRMPGRDRARLPVN